MNFEHGCWSEDYQPVLEPVETNSPLILQHPKVFYHDLIRSIDEAEESVWLRSMVYGFGKEYIDNLSRHLSEAARRFVQVHMEIDGYSQSFIDKESHIGWILKDLGTLLKGREGILELLQHREFRKEYEAMVQGLRDSGVDWTWVNPPRGAKRLMPFVNVDHTKMVVIDEKVAWGAAGAGNMYDGNFESIDYMAKTYHPDLVAAFCDLFPRVNENQPKDDYEIVPIPDYHFLVDSGRKGKSLIYKTAVEIVEDADEEIRMVTELLPDGKLLDIMKYKARHGTKVFLYTIRRDDYLFSTFPFNFMLSHLLSDIKKSEIILLHTSSPKHLHAKGLFTKLGASLITSHNFTMSGVRAGTQELGVCSTDLRLAVQMEDFIKSIPI